MQCLNNKYKLKNVLLGGKFKNIGDSSGKFSIYSLIFWKLEFYGRVLAPTNNDAGFG